MLTPVAPKRIRAADLNPLPDLWNSEFTARYLRCSLGTLLKMAQAGEIPAAKIGRGWVFDPMKVRAWLHARMGGKT
jgi:excisionase family DNA binding protein